VRERHSDTLGEDLLLVTVPVANDGAVVGALRVSAPLGEVEAGVRQSWLGLVLIGLTVIAAGLVLAWILAGTVARPLERLSVAAGRIGGGDLDARVTPEKPREVETVGRSFNRMADAVAASVASQRDFVANASHQLRTPLTGIKLRLEAIRAEGGPAAEEAEKADAELDRLSALVDDLLELAGASSAAPEGELVDLGGAARDAIERWQEPARAAGHELRLRDGAAAPAWAAEVDVAQILDNLLENAIRYSGSGSEITIDADGRVLTVADTGPGIPRDERPHVFERFYRGAEGRRTSAGTGLGLAIVAELAGRWSAEVAFVDGPGTRIRIVFPAPPADSSPVPNRS
jgi:two-component system, OmpR family, sensor kinase